MADDFERDDMDEEVPVITMVDDETGEETECVVIDRISNNGAEYMLVIESHYIDDDEADAKILKVVGETEDDITYSVVDDGEEFEAVAALFGNDEYDVEF